MAFDSNGVFTLPIGYKAVTGQTILASQHNPPLESIEAGLSQVLLRSGVAPMTGNLRMNGFRAIGLADGVDPQDAATKAQLDAIVIPVAAPIPIGAIIPYAGASAPSDWLLCFGQAVSRSTYDLLFSAIGTTYGPGDGSTTFNLPDLRGRAVAGKDDMGGVSANRLTDQSGGVNGDTLGDAGGVETHTLTDAQLASHGHGGGTLTASAAGAHAHTIEMGGSGGAGGANRINTDNNENFNWDSANSLGVSNAVTSTAANHTHTLTGSTGTVGSDAAHNNVQPTIILNYIIRSGV